MFSAEEGSIRYLYCLYSLVWLGMNPIDLGLDYSFVLDNYNFFLSDFPLK
jgi:hypothetical protein